MPNSRISLSALVVLFFSISHNAYAETLQQAAETIGQVVWAKGAVKASQPNMPIRSLSRRSPIYQQDTLTTDNHSAGEIVFTDDSIVSIRESSMVKFSNYQYKKNAPHGTAEFAANVVKGGFRTITGAISKNNPEGYQVSTPVATIGVSGTDYSVYYNPITNEMATQLDYGSIVITNPQGAVRLTKCVENPNCIDQLYARVSGLNQPPVAAAQKPAVFNTETPITPASAPAAATANSTAPASTTVNSTAPASTGKTSNGEVVGGFCIQ